MIGYIMGFACILCGLFHILTTSDVPGTMLLVVTGVFCASMTYLSRRNNASH